MKKSTTKRSKDPSAPALSPAAQAWRRRLEGDFDLDDPAAQLLLTTALRAFDRMHEAADVVATHGVVVTDRYGQLKSNPATTVERDSRAAMLAALRALNLDVLPPQPVGRPPGR